MVLRILFHAIHTLSLLTTVLKNFMCRIFCTHSLERICRTECIVLHICLVHIKYFFNVCTKQKGFAMRLIEKPKLKRKIKPKCMALLQALRKFRSCLTLRIYCYFKQYMLVAIFEEISLSKSQISILLPRPSSGTTNNINV